MLIKYKVARKLLNNNFSVSKNHFSTEFQKLKIQAPDKMELKFELNFVHIIETFRVKQKAMLIFNIKESKF